MFASLDERRLFLRAASTGKRSGCRFTVNKKKNNYDVSMKNCCCRYTNYILYSYIINKNKTVNVNDKYRVGKTVLSEVRYDRTVT